MTGTPPGLPCTAHRANATFGVQPVVSLILIRVAAGAIETPPEVTIGLRRDAFQATRARPKASAIGDQHYVRSPPASAPA